jgi:hypothetical protein
MLYYTNYNSNLHVAMFTFLENKLFCNMDSQFPCGARIIRLGSANRRELIDGHRGQFPVRKF